MKCPKCGYLGFEATERCRNCGYDFSLAAPAPSAELPLRTAAADAPLVDLELADDTLIGEAPESLHERAAAGFGRTEPKRATPLPLAAVARTGAAEPAAPAVPAPRPAPEEESEDLPLFSPRPAGNPLAVRRPGHDVPKPRRTTTRPARAEPPPALPLVAETTEPVSSVRPSSARPAPPEPAGVGRRLAAAIIDLVLLLTIDAGVMWLTLRIAGLTPTVEDARTIRLVPMAGFLCVLAFLYLAGFTVGGGQTIGKMLAGIRVTGDDGRGVDITGAVVRALGCIAAVATLGMLFVPALFGADRRAVHDRLAGTRVVVG
jgi:uncharacterized RDD family membrane protein YckC